MLVGESFGVIFVLFVGGTFLSFSSKFNLGGSISDASLSLLFALFLVGPHPERVQRERPPGLLGRRRLRLHVPGEAAARSSPRRC